MKTQLITAVEALKNTLQDVTLSFSKALELNTQLEELTALIEALKETPQVEEVKTLDLKITSNRDGFRPSFINIGINEQLPFFVTSATYENLYNWCNDTNNEAHPLYCQISEEIVRLRKRSKDSQALAELEEMVNTYSFMLGQYDYLHNEEQLEKQIRRALTNTNFKYISAEKVKEAFTTMFTTKHNNISTQIQTMKG